MKALVVYYSRSGSTSKISNLIANSLECDIEAIVDTKNRSGLFGWIKSARDARNKKLTVISPPKNDPAQYDLLIIGTPIWAGHISAPVRTYIHEKQAYFNNVAFFCTAGGDKFVATFKDMQELSGAAPVATMGISRNDLKNGSYESKVKDFVKAVQM
ncbi:MAG TPA: flavodoxin family protein [Methanobacterium sp.]|nr:flavodoxin family protein [Methanobacterium sp.]